MRTALLIILPLVALLALYVGMRDGVVPDTGDIAAAAPTMAAPAPARSAPEPPPMRTEVFAIAAGAVTGGPRTVALKVGDALRIEVTSDQDGELHLHGYDLSLQLRKGAAATLALDTHQAGRFALEVHAAKGHGHIELGVLEVQP